MTLDLRFEEAFKRTYPYPSLSSFLPYDRFDPSTNLFITSTSCGFVLETIPLVGCTQDMQREISGLFKYLLPEGTFFQCLLYSDPDLNSLLMAWKNRRSSSLLVSLAQKRVDYLDHLIRNPHGVIHPRRFRCLLSISRELTNDFLKDLKTLQSLKEQLITLLKGLDLPYKIWHANDLLEFVSAFITGYESTPSWNRFEPLCKQVLTQGHLIQVDDEHLAIQPEGRIIKTYTVTKMPSFWSLYAMNDLLGDKLRPALSIPVPFFFHYGVYIPPQGRLQPPFQAKAAWVEKQVLHPNMRKMLPHLVDEADEIAFVRKQLASGERMVKAQWSCGLICPSDTVHQAEQSLFNLFRSKEWELSSNRYLHFVSLLNVLPLSWAEGFAHDMDFLKNMKTTISSEAANVLPLQGEWQGTSTPGMLLIGRRGQIFTWSPFDNTAGNYNTCVVGRSGSGKSVFMQELMTSLLGAGGRVFVMDVGRSFEKVCKSLGGQYIEFTPSTTLSLNPFSGLQSLDSASLDDGLAMIKPLLSLMAAPKEGTSDRENALLEKALYKVWDRYGSNGSITALSDYLLTSDDSLGKELGTMLYPYTDTGLYGKYFKGAANVSFTHPLVVIELEELKERKDLQAVIVQMIILHITQHMFGGDRQTPFTLIFDEAWDLLRGSQGGVFMETLARRVRKYRGALVVGTQSVNDFFASPAAQAAFDNADWMALLSQKKESIALLKETKRLLLDPTMEELLQSVKTKQGEYAEVMIYGPHGYAIGRLVLDPFSRILYSTKAEEFSSVRALQAQGYCLEEAIERVAKQTFGREDFYT